MKRIVLLLCLLSLVLLAACNPSAPSTLDYSDGENWTYFAAGDGAADVFLIAPTTFIHDEVFNMPADDADQRRRFGNALNRQRGIYEEHTRMFAPFYRQAALAVYSMEDVRAAAYFEVAYADVRAAFLYYWENHNGGRPIVLAGFSQGADMALRLVKEFFGEEAKQELLVAAYLIGWRITEEDIAAYPHLKMATGEADTGVIVSFNTEAEHIQSSLIVPDRTRGINPLNWSTGSEYAPKELNRGACFPASDGSIREEIPHLTGAFLDPVRGTLKVTGISPAEYPPGLDIFEEGVYHLYDYQFFYRNLQENVGVRINAFVAGNGANHLAGRPTAQIVILHTNDMHGRIVGNDTNIIGIDRVAAIHRNTPNSILVDAGDTFHGLPIATLSRGADIAALMREAGYGAMVVGNHEFNYGWERLAELRGIAGFPVLASNVTQNGAQFLDDTVIIEIDGVKIGLFGVTTEATGASAMPDYVRGLTFHDPIAAARVNTEYLRGRGAHIVVALSHLGTEPYRGTLSTRLAYEVPGIDVIIDGHSHTGLPDGLMENGVLIAQAGYHGSSVGRVTISVEDGVIVFKTAALIGFEEAQHTAPDPIIADKLSEIMSALEAVLNEPLGESAAAMSSARNPGLRTQEMPIGSLVADAYREAAGADIAIANGGDIRADIAVGVITKGDVISILPFGNTLMVKNVTPAILREVLENGVSAIVADSAGNIDHELSPAGRFLQVSGFSFVYDPAAPVGERVVSIALDDGRLLALDDNTTILSLAGSNYVMTGGDYYIMLGELPVERELGAADEALAEHIARHSPVNAPAEDRIVSARQE